MPTANANAVSDGTRDVRAIEDRTHELGRFIFEHSGRFFRKRLDKVVSEKMMEWSMRHPAFKIEAFRFVDVLPTLVHPNQVVSHMREYFLESGTPIPFWIKSGLNVATNLPWAEKLTAAVVRQNVTRMAAGFITGQDSATATANLRAIWDGGQCFTVDILGEAAVAEVEAVDYQRRYIELIKGLSREVKSWPSSPLLEDSPLGKVPRANVSVKCSSLYSQIDPLAFRTSVDAIKNRLRPILETARQCGVMVNLDMEQDDYRELFLAVAEEIFWEDGLKDYPHFGLVIQAYLKCSQNDLARVIEYSRKRGSPLTVRLVKGAYWDYEVIQARQRGWDIPVYTDKAETDANYEACTDMLLESWPHVIAAFGSHNVRSLSHAMARGEELGLAKNAFEAQMLYGMADAFKRAVTKLGYRVREYAPVGQILPGMAYLVRRLLENTSNESFLRVKYMKPSEATKFLDAPTVDKGAKLALLKADQPRNEDVKVSPKPVKRFENEPMLDFAREENRKWIEPTLKKLRAALPIVVNPVVDGVDVEGTPVFQWHNPSRRQELVTKFTMANQYHADLAFKACEKAKETWGRADAVRRAEVIRKAGRILSEKRKELIAVIVLETGKNFKEADADVCEAVDFCRYYADRMEELASPAEMGGLPGEANHYGYRPRGTAVAIAPWNFPIAILTGMTVAPLVCGNPVIMKPAEQSTGIALFLYHALIEAGVPREAIHLLPGSGEVVGEYLVNHSQTHIVNFTGSKAVGLLILRNAYQPLPGQKHIKHVVAELGGKNGMIIDEDADLDEAVLAALHSVFGFQGQKCSACSRIFILETCYERFKQRFVEAMLSLKIGAADDPAAKAGPVIDDEAKTRLMDVINRNRAKIVAQLPVPGELADRGRFVPLTVFEDTDPKSELGQREFFGPLVTLFKVRTMDEAIHAMNDVDYALTGGIFSRSPAHLERAKAEIEVGNLYVNRGITGALVNRQPFGGFKLSGCGAKAGGPDYLLQFLEPVTVTENTMRRGFAPEL
jgi:RHH-type proline utilization regulon transcriptional repressor/proline dehydrogenase/delta 1-pyrroline-5-carboxylate dehydrogenase